MKKLIQRIALLIAAACAAASTALAGGLTDYAESQIISHYFRTGVIAAKPTTIAIALISATKGTWAASTAYVANDTVIPATPNARIYRQTVASCTSAATAPVFPTTSAGIVADGTCSWTEQTVALEACTFTEVPNAGAYARATLNPLDANWSAPTAGAGTGTGQTGNSVAITYTTPTANWAGTVWGFMITDSATYGLGNCIAYAALTLPKVVNSGDSVSFAVGALTVQIDQ